MRTSQRNIAGGLLAGLLLSGCGGGQRVTEPPRAAARAPRPPLAHGLSAADYVAAAGELDLYVITASELALKRTQAPRVREVAERLIVAHRGSSAQLSLGGRRLNLLPSAALSPRYQQLLEQLYASANFDPDYALQMKVAHQDAARLHSDYARSGGSPTLVPIARALAPIMEQQKRLVSYL
ncbi:MAG: DUF4142 domain-containing protein [Sphingomicrobium sp.]